MDFLLKSRSLVFFSPTFACRPAKAKLRHRWSQSKHCGTAAVAHSFLFLWQWIAQLSRSHCCTCECYWSYSHQVIMIKPILSQELFDHFERSVTDSWREASFFQMEANNTNYFHKETLIKIKRHQGPISNRLLECAGLDYTVCSALGVIFCVIVNHLHTICPDKHVWNEKHINICPNTQERRQRFTFRLHAPPPLPDTSSGDANTSKFTNMTSRLVEHASLTTFRLRWKSNLVEHMSDPPNNWLPFGPEQLTSFWCLLVVGQLKSNQSLFI